MTVDITFCTNRNCEKADSCIRNIKNKYYPKETGAVVSCVAGCKDYELYWEKENDNSKSKNYPC